MDEWFLHLFFLYKSEIHCSSHFHACLFRFVFMFELFVSILGPKLMPNRLCHMDSATLLFDYYFLFIITMQYKKMYLHLNSKNSTSNPKPCVLYLKSWILSFMTKVWTPNFIPKVATLHFNMLIPMPTSSHQPPRTSTIAKKKKREKRKNKTKQTWRQ